MSIIEGNRAKALVESMVDPEIQIQMCGVELTLQRVERFISKGEVAFDNSERKISQTAAVEFDESGWVYLKPSAYLITFNEIVVVPRDMAALARPRSSLLRMGATIETALWDPGYRGRSQSLLVVYNQEGLSLKKDARLIQLIFIGLDNEAEKVYTGIYQGENIKSISQ